MAGSVNTPWVTRWGHDDDSWNHEDPDDFEVADASDSDGSGNPGRSLVGAAVARWALNNPQSAGKTDVIAAIFNLPLSMAEDIAVHGDFRPARLGPAIQVWSALQNQFGETPVAACATALNVPPPEIIRAVEDHPWMFLSGPRDDLMKLMIEHDGD